MALDIIINYEYNEINAYKDHLYNFFKKEKIRDELTLFSIHKDNTIISENDRKVILPIIISILFPMLFEKKGKRNRSAYETSKNVVFAFFSGLEI